MGMETPCERTELYDNFDIYHEMLMSENAKDESSFCDEGIKSLET